MDSSAAQTRHSQQGRADAVIVQNLLKSVHGVHDFVCSMLQPLLEFWSGAPVATLHRQHPIRFRIAVSSALWLDPPSTLVNICWQVCKSRQSLERKGCASSSSNRALGKTCPALRSVIQKHWCAKGRSTFLGMYQVYAPMCTDSRTCRHKLHNTKGQTALQECLPR